MQVILASASPRRKQLLSEIFEDFKVLPQNADENCKTRSAYAICQNIAKQKLGNLPRQYPNALIISADTIVRKGRKLYGKPKDRQEAKCFLDELSGQCHSVFTGVAIYYSGEIHTFYDESMVKFKPLSEEDKWNYIDTGSPMDKAGGYGIQDSQVVERYLGSYSNIVGLPMEKLKEQLSKIIK